MISQRPRATPAAPELTWKSYLSRVVRPQHKHKVAANVPSRRATAQHPGIRGSSAQSGPGGQSSDATTLYTTLTDGACGRQRGREPDPFLQLYTSTCLVVSIHAATCLPLPLLTRTDRRSDRFRRPRCP